MPDAAGGGHPSAPGRRLLPDVGPVSGEYWTWGVALLFESGRGSPPVAACAGRVFRPGCGVAKSCRGGMPRLAGLFSLPVVLEFLPAAGRWLPEFPVEGAFRRRDPALRQPDGLISGPHQVKDPVPPFALLDRAVDQLVVGFRVDPDPAFGPDHPPPVVFGWFRRLILSRFLGLVQPPDQLVRVLGVHRPGFIVHAHVQVLGVPADVPVEA